MIFSGLAMARLAGFEEKTKDVTKVPAEVSYGSCVDGAMARTF
jgi:hypothetical protein